ncbi:hypothetical protein G9A89_015164 [Geosiphon pyriformis]|nr:hypothetical protein G9A89_015164 [Geosiphon pyriformis]
MFESTKDNNDLNIMWKILEEAVVQTVNVVFSKIWYNKYNCSRNKQSSKFFKLELLIAKIVKYQNSGNLLNFDHFVKVWLDINKVKVFMVVGLILDGASLIDLIKHLLVVRKRYRKFKYCEFKIAEDIAIKKIIDHCIKNFCSNKKWIIRSILECPFCKVVLDHLVVDDVLVVEPNEIKLKIDKIMKG